MTHLPPDRGAPAAGIDRLGLRHTTQHPAALAAFADAAEGLAAYRRDVPDCLERALAAAPGMPAALALRGLTLLLAARAETVAAARRVLSKLPSGPRTDDEAALVGALAAGLATGPLAAAEVLATALRRRPGLLLFVKLATALRFLGGDGAGMRRLTAAVLPAWSADMPGYGYVLGCHAFALEEAGDYAAAERFGRAAIAHTPADPWAIHAVAHVHEMTGQPAAGAAWIEARRADWQGCNNFAGHLAWHLALFRLAQGDVAAALDLYDREIRAEPSEDMRDYANAVSLLWRLRQHGIAVGPRWQELAAIARRRRGETVLLFAALHRLLALLAVGDAAAAGELVAGLAHARGEQGVVARQVGLPLGRALVGVAEAGRRAELGTLAAGLAALGGSNAQRDVFVRSLAILAAERGDRAARDAILAVRRRLRAEDRLADLLPTQPRRAA